MTNAVAPRVTDSALFRPDQDDGVAMRIHVGIVHNIPGRLRLRAKALKGQTSLSEKVRRQLEGVPGLTGFSANPHTGSIVLEYDDEITPENKFVDELMSRGLVLVARESPKVAAFRRRDDLTKLIVDSLIRFIIERLTLRIITALA